VNEKEEQKKYRDEEVKGACGLLPPRMVTAGGNADAMAGDMARPVQMTIGNTTKMTNRYVSR
jgi:hypothetical protein